MSFKTLSPWAKFSLILCAAFLLWYTFCLPRRLFDEPLSAVLYSSDGRLLGARASAAGQWYFAPSDSVPDKFAECLIAYEDKRFRTHSGVDPLSVGRAVCQNISRARVVSGASTITMQVIRMSRRDEPRTFWEKVCEAFLATRLELRCSKDDILLMYAANAPFGGNVIGLEAAAWRYYGRPPASLSWGESALLAVLPNSPGLIHPGRNREALLAKRNALLDKLLLSGAIDSLECELSKEEPLPDSPLPMPDLAYHLLERCRLEGGDGTYTTTVDFDLQNKVGGIVGRYFPSNHSNLVDNMSVLVTEVGSGKVLAYYGNTRSCDPSVRGGSVDMVPALRSSGSTLKPLLYAAMLQKGMIYPQTLIKDTPYNSHNFSPHNYSKGFEGAVPASSVISRSLNVPSVRMLEDYGVGAFLDVLHGVGLSEIDASAGHYGLSLILGGAEVSLQGLSLAYNRMAALLAGDGLPENLSWLKSEEHRCLDAGDFPFGRAAVWLSFDAVSRSSRPEEEASWMEFNSAERIAWKTGTSWGNRDAWSIGATRDYVVAVWVGNSDGEGRSGMTGVNYAAPVMFDVFSCLPRSAWFEMPQDDMKMVEVCRSSGQPAGLLCPETDAVMVPDVASLPMTCPYHVLVHLSPDGLYQVNSACCDPTLMRHEVRFVLPPVQEWYYMRAHVDYEQLPPKHPDYDASISSSSSIEIIYPQDGFVVIPTRGLAGGEKRGIVCRAAHSSASAVLYWHLDGEYLGETVGEHRMLVKLTLGKHRLTVVDVDGVRAGVDFSSR